MRSQKCQNLGSNYLIVFHIARIARYNSLGWWVSPLRAVSWVCRMLINTERQDTSDIVPKNCMLTDKISNIVILIRRNHVNLARKVKNRTVNT